ncbi:hypothetical protein CTZ00_17600 [Acinetobacter baumannii]|nr:hypothetical protein [Acinetobacter baumannii]
MDSVSRSEIDCVIFGEMYNRNVNYDFVKYDESGLPIHEWTYFRNEKSYHSEKDAVSLAKSQIYMNRVKNIRVMKEMPNGSWVKVDLQNSP